MAAQVYRKEEIRIIQRYIQKKKIIIRSEFRREVTTAAIILICMGYTYNTVCASVRHYYYDKRCF